MGVDRSAAHQAFFHLQIRRDHFRHAAGFSGDFRANPVARKKKECLVHDLACLLRNKDGRHVPLPRGHVTHGF
jgi:hypothetical protein